MTEQMLEIPEYADSSMTVVVDTTEHSTVATDSAARDLYRQAPGTVVNCQAKGHPKKHVLKLKGKSNGRDITITIEDPTHSIHSLRLQLYKPGRKPGQTAEVGDVVTLENNAKTCPPLCDS
jgi:hypothetical protein